MKYKRNGWRGLILSLLLLISFPYVCAAQNTAAAVRIQAQLKLEGTGQMADVPFFVFRLESEEGDPLPAKTEVSLQEAGTIDFDQVTYQVPGNYHYRIYQKVPTPDGRQKAAAKDQGTGSGTLSYGTLTMDTRSYDLTVQVITDENGNLAASVCMYLAGTKKKTEPEFLNSFLASKKPLPQAPIKPKGTAPVRTGDLTPVIPLLFMMFVSLAVIRKLCYIQRCEAKRFYG